MTCKLLSPPKDLFSKTPDVLIHVGEEPNTETFTAQLSVLITRSQYFAVALSSDWAKKENEIIKFTKPNITPQVFEIVLKHIYCEAISLERLGFQTLLDILVAADELLLERLTELTEAHLIAKHAESLSKGFVHIHQTVFQYESCKRLQNFCTDLVATNPKVVFYSEDFTSLDENILVSLLRRDDLSMNEIDIWNKVVQWGIFQTNSLSEDPSSWSTEDFGNLAKVLDKMLPLIRFYHISPTDFHQKVKPYAKILPETLYEDLLHHQNRSLFKLFPTVVSYIKNKVTHADHSKVSDSFVTDIRSKSPRFECPSEIISSSQIQKIINWIIRDTGDSPSNKLCYGVRLICRGSRDGFTPKDFHRKCDHKGATITLFKAKGMNLVIGGYNPMSWNQNGVWECNKNIFIFSFGAKAQPKRKLSGYPCVISTSRVGPIFDSHLFASEWALHIAGPNFTTAHSCYCGNARKPAYFQIEEYEVIQVIRR